ncbi:MAG: diguanylate cyclase [Xanthomonadaceae bacterium]|nr:diguanylate cyclase [Xanthomonadaceae bacterium]
MLRQSSTLQRCRILAGLLWLLALAPLTADDGVELDRLIDRIEVVHTREHWQQSQQMIDLLRSSLESATVDQLARLDLMQGRNLILAGQHTDSLELIDDILRRPVSLDHRVRALELAANASSLIHQYANAFEYLAEALRLMPEFDHSIRKANIVGLAARMHGAVGESALALQYAAESLQLAEQSGQSRVICDSWFTLVTAQINAGLDRIAVNSTQSLWRQCHKTDDPVMIGASMGLIGWTYHSAGEHDRAIGWLERSIEHNREAGFDLGLLESGFTLALARIANGQSRKGVSMLEQLLGRLESMQRWGDLMEAHSAVAMVHQREGRYEQALEHLRQFREVESRFFDDQREQRLAYLQVEFESRRLEQELKFLQQENQVLNLREQADESRRRARALGGMMIGLVVLLLAGLLLRFRADRRRYRALASTDGLTGLLNHAAFHRETEQALADAGSPDRVCCLIAADVDFFKQVNDRYGHQAGDAVLSYLGRLLREQFPPPCIVGRIGGEEFGIFLPDHNRLQARQRLRAFRKQIKPVRFDGLPIEITLSFGLSETRRESRIETVRGWADEALYRAKRSGRNELVDANDLCGAMSG